MVIYNENYDELKEKYAYLKEVIKRTNKELTEFQIDKIYVKSLKEAVFLCGKAENLNLIILKYMKKHLFDCKFDDNIEEKTIIRKINAQDLEPKEVLTDKEPKEEIKLDTEIKEKDDKPVVHQEKVEPKEDISLSYDNVQIIDEKGRLNLSFLNILLIKKIMSKAELAVELKISMVLIDKVLNGEYHLKEESLSRLYKKYKTHNAYELRDIINNLETKTDDYLPKKEDYLPKKDILEKEEEKIEISNELLEKYNDELKELIKKYIIVKNISISRFSILIKCAYSSFYHQLRPKEKITEYTAECLRRYFKVKNIEQLVVLLREKTKDYDEEIKETKEIDEYSEKVSELIKIYIVLNNLSQRRFAKLIGSNEYIISLIVNKKTKISDGLDEKLFNFFEVNTREELIDLLENIKKDYINIVEEIEKKSKYYSDTIKELLIQYKISNNMSIKKLSASVGISPTATNDIINNKRQISEEVEQKISKHLGVSTKVDLIIKLIREIAKAKNCLCKNEINMEILFKVVDVSSLINDEYIIFMLLFGEDSCSVGIISELLKIDKEYILDMYKNYLDKYNEELKREKLNNFNIMKFKADN